MDIVNFMREQEEFQRHIKRVQNVQPCTDTSTPKSLGLKHLALRPKKQQLIDDRNHVIAQENKKMMEKMTKVKYLYIIQFYSFKIFTFIFFNQACIFI